MFAAKFPISPEAHGILYVYYTLIFFVPAIFLRPIYEENRWSWSKVNRFKISSVQGASLFIYIGSHLALKVESDKI